MTRPPVSSIANGLAWLVWIGLAALAIVIVLRIGPVGLMLLGLVTLFVCTQFTLDDRTPTWSIEVFRARMARPGSPEQRAADAAEHQASISPLRFYRACGLVLSVAGAAGFLWQCLG